MVVKSTAGLSDDFAEQDGLYTVCVRGVDSNGETIDEAVTVGAISRVAVSYTHLDVYKRQLLWDK